MKRLIVTRAGVRTVDLTADEEAEVVARRAAAEAAEAAEEPAVPMSERLDALEAEVQQMKATRG